MLRHYDVSPNPNIRIIGTRNLVEFGLRLFNIQANFKYMYMYNGKEQQSYILIYVFHLQSNLAR